MTQKIIVLVLGLLISSSAMAQEYGALLGFNQSSASVDEPAGANGSISGKMGFNAGLAIAFELSPGMRFRSGFLYDQRQVDYKTSNGKYQLNFAYFDVPVNLQYALTPTVAVFGGMVVGVKASDSVKSPSGYPVDLDTKSLYPLVNAGLNFTFDDMIGFDFFVERGIGEFASESTTDLSFKDYMTFGLRFIYWL